jgi:molecular chaperone DnaK
MPVVIKNELDDNAAVMPSVVLVEESGSVVVGLEAKKGAVADPGRVFEEIKRSMGDPDYYPREIDGVAYRPEFVSSLILKKLANYASKATGETVEDVVITVPAYFGESMREATRVAGGLAGLNVLHILNEPTAAALCYGDKSQLI